MLSIFAFFLAALTPQQRAIDFLSREVPRWARENHCYSCHNNGDAARALYLAKQRGYIVPPESIADTSAWLQQPAKWNEIHGNPAASDRKLARIQFAAALAEAYRTGATRNRQALVAAAEALLAYQDANGSWVVDTGGLPGAPAAYGTALATYMTRRTLETAGSARFAQPIARANQWFASASPGSLVDAAAILLALPGNRKCLEWILSAQTSDGGWGPQPKMPAEAFDTALAMLALHASGQTEPLARARGLLFAMQEASGAWPETTRPSGGHSYAEHISTAGWVVYALLTTDAQRQ